MSNVSDERGKLKHRGNKAKCLIAFDREARGADALKTFVKNKPHVEELEKGCSEQIVEAAERTRGR